jgi:hypothetical protein
MSIGSYSKYNTLTKVEKYLGVIVIMRKEILSSCAQLRILSTFRTDSKIM